jgi:YHS domain-containing protein
MSAAEELQTRIEAEFAENERKLKQTRDNVVEDYEERQQRLNLFDQVCDRLRDFWRPRLELLAAKFGEHVQVAPKISRESRQVLFSFDSKLARVELRFSASTDEDVRNLVLDYNLDVLPILMNFERHAQQSYPLDAVDADQVAQWFDDRIIDFVHTYLSMSHNKYYLKGHTVTDPIAGVSFNPAAAAVTLEHGGKTYHFISEKTCNEFKQRETAS